MGVINPHTTIHPRHANRRLVAEHVRIAQRYRPSAREVFEARNAERIAHEAAQEAA